MAKTQAKSPLPAIDRVADILKRRGVRRLAYFHTDHFEPYRSVPGRDPAYALGAGDVEAFAAAAAGLETARRSSLFFKPNVAYLLSDRRELYRGHPADRIGFAPATDDDRALSRAMLAPLAAGEHDIQLHIHHEHYTYNDTGRDQRNRDYLAAPEARRHDAARVELAVRLSLDVLRQDAGIALERWFFVHGLWALNASDPHECTIVREIELLRRNGCLGDFTQPAGRVHVDSRIDTPHLVDPFPYAKGYDTAGANPSQAEGAGVSAADRFFIWASAVDHRLSSIDTYSKMVQARLKDPERFALGHAGQGVVIDGVLYVKTHAHSMAPPYWTPEDGRPFPHADPGVQAELGFLFDAATCAGAEIAFPTVTEVYDEIVGAPAPAARDLIMEARLPSAPPTAQLGLTVVYRDAESRIVPPPPLEPLGPIPEPAVVDPSAPAGPVVAAEIAPVAFPGQGGAKSASGEDVSPLDSADVILVDRIASRTALARLTALGPESGVSGSYISRSEQGALIQKAEAACADMMVERFADVESIHEIGCGLGVLTTLLAARGFNAVGFEQNAARCDTAAAIAEAVSLQNPSQTGSAVFVAGVFPETARGRPDLSRSVALVTNLLGSASEAKQAAVIRGLTRYKACLIDMQRFYDRRTETADIDALAARFRSAGFAPPELAFDLGGDGRYLLFTSRVAGMGAMSGSLRALRARVGSVGRRLTNARAS